MKNKQKEQMIWSEGPHVTYYPCAPVNTPAQYSFANDQQRQKNATRNQPTAMDLYFLDWVRTRDKTEPEKLTKAAHTVL